MAATNNVTRMLDARKIPYTVFEIPAVKLTALEVCDHLHIPPEDVYKTIVLRREKKGKPILTVVPATGEVDPKKLAGFLKEKKVSVTTQRDAEKMTGLLSGGISPLALINKGFQVVIDESAIERKIILISGGQRGLQIQLAVHDLIKLTNARTANISSQV
jgi:Cys-tRNA(Pro)/Cys-tRNA(Cys) deacylase